MPVVASMGEDAALAAQPQVPSRQGKAAAYIAYLIVTSALIYAVGFITTALGVLVMTLALAGFAAYAIATSTRADNLADQFAGTADTELFRWREVGIAVLASFPAVFVPSELTSPMASLVFVAMFAVPSYGAAFAWHAWSRWQSQRDALAPAVMAEIGVAPPPPGWYGDPADARFLRWWDGRHWTPHVQPRLW